MLDRYVLVLFHSVETPWNSFLGFVTTHILSFQAVIDSSRHPFLSLGFFFYVLAQFSPNIPWHSLSPRCIPSLAMLALLASLTMLSYYSSLWLLSNTISFFCRGLYPQHHFRHHSLLSYPPAGFALHWIPKKRLFTLFLLQFCSIAGLFCWWQLVRIHCCSFLYGKKNIAIVI